MLYSKKFAQLLTLSATIACGDNASKGGNPQSSSLNGVYTTGCLSDGDPIDPDFHISNITFSGLNLTMDSQTYSDATCSKKTFSLSSSLTYTLGTLLPGQDSTYKFDITIQTIKVAFHDAEKLQNANQNQFYGIGDWALGIDREVTGKKVTASSTDTPLAKGTVNYSSIKNSDNKIRFGDSGVTSGTSEQTRSVTLDKNVYTKK